MSRIAAASGNKEPFSIVHVLEDYSLVSGGVAAVVNQMAGRLTPFCSAVDLVCVRPNPMSPPDGVRLLEVTPSSFGKGWGWSQELGTVLATAIPNSGRHITHVHGVWMAPQWFGAKLSLRKDQPFVLTLHAMLQPWFWYNQGWKVRIKKQAYWNFVASSVLKRASVVHAITPLERDDVHRLFPTQRIEVIPNAIDLVDLDAQLPESDTSPEPIILFLGRIHPQKGIDILVRAFAKAKLPDKWRLVIAGPTGSPAYEGELRRMVELSDLDGRVEFIGPIFGEVKWNWIKRAWVVAVPSNTEVVGIVNLEAAACGTPTITTHETGLTRWGESGGMLINPDVNELAVSLQKACAWTDFERLNRGEVSRRFIEQFFSWDVVLPQWLELYESVLEEGGK